MSEFWLCFNCCIAEQPQPVSMTWYTHKLGGVLGMHTVDSQAKNQDSSSDCRAVPRLVSEILNIWLKKEKSKFAFE